MLEGIRKRAMPENNGGRRFNVGPSQGLLGKLIGKNKGAPPKKDIVRKPEEEVTKHIPAYEAPEVNINQEDPNLANRLINRPPPVKDRTIPGGQNFADRMRALPIGGPQKQLQAMPNPTIGHRPTGTAVGPESFARRRPMKTAANRMFRRVAR